MRKTKRIEPAQPDFSASNVLNWLTSNFMEKNRVDPAHPDF